MNPVDPIFALILLLALLRGWSRGLVGTIAGYVAPVAAFVMTPDWSDLVRQQLAARIPPQAEIFLDMLAPLVTFLAIVIVIRLLAFIVSRVLGLGLSRPSRVLAAALTLVVSALVLGGFVVLAHQLPRHGGAGTEAAATPLEKTMLTLDERFSTSVLGPPLAGFAGAVIDEAIAHKDDIPILNRQEFEDAARRAAAAADAMGKGQEPPRGNDPGSPHRSDDGATRHEDSGSARRAEPVHHDDPGAARRGDSGTTRRDDGGDYAR